MDNSLVTEISGAFSDLTTLLTGTVVPAAVGLAVAGIGVTYALKWVRKAASR